MWGIVYLALCVCVGWKFVELIVKKEQKNVNSIWVYIAASWATGILGVTWLLYIAAYFFSVCGNKEQPLRPANILIMLIVAGGLLLSLYTKRNVKCGYRDKITGYISDRKSFYIECVFYAVLFLFIWWTMSYVFYVKNGILFSGVTVYGDYAPHTAMMRSFSWGNNFPTQYPHFGGEDVKYHFMFQFLTGNLEFLGIRIDWAYNLTGTVSLWAFLVMLSQFFKKLFGKGIGFFLLIPLFFFRSGTAFLQFAAEHIANGDFWKSLKENVAFIGYTPNENWGLWNYNVYLNQRHLAFGMLIALIAVWVYIEWLEKGCEPAGTKTQWLKERFLSKRAWKNKNPETALLIGMLLGLCSFWNGAAVIGGLLILMGMAIFSDAKLDYLITAIVAVVFSVIQSNIFIRGSAVSPAILIGFICEDKTLTGILLYLFKISGIVFLGILFIWKILKLKERCLAIAFLMPVCFTFIFSLTPDVTVNHKYIMIAYAFMIVIWSFVLQELFRRKKGFKLLSAFLLITLMITGIYDFTIVIRGNGANRKVGVNLESGVTQWVSENLEKHDLMLTPEYSLSEVTMSGEMLYCGWPYYAWSAGYDTWYRAGKAIEIYTTDNKETLMQIVKEEKITYILYEEDMKFEEHVCREDIIKEAYEQVFVSADGKIHIYKVNG